MKEITRLVRKFVTFHNGLNQTPYIATVQVLDILNMRGYKNCIIGSKVMAILLEGWICLLVELHREGSASAACAEGLIHLYLDIWVKKVITLFHLAPNYISGQH